MIDSHAHIHDRLFDDDRYLVLARAAERDVSVIITVGTSVDDSRSAIDCVHAYQTSTADDSKKVDLFVSIGIHPHECRDTLLTLDDIVRSVNDILSLVDNNTVVAIGEIGLDYYSRDGLSIPCDVIDRQKELFTRQLLLAHEFKKPVIIHCRDAYDDVITILSRLWESGTCPMQCVLHCYDGAPQHTEQFLHCGPIVFFGCAGNVTYVKRGSQRWESHVQKWHSIPRDRILCETDCPFLAPFPHRGERSEPSFLSDTVAFLADMYACDVDELRYFLDSNTARFFGW